MIVRKSGVKQTSVKPVQHDSNFKLADSADEKRTDEKHENRYSGNERLRFVHGDSLNFNRSNLFRNSIILPTAEFAKTKLPNNEGPTLTSGLTLINELKYTEEDPIVARVSDDNDYWAVGYSRGVIRIFTRLGESSSSYGCSANTLTLKVSEEIHQVTDIKFCPKTRLNKEPRLLATYASGYIRLWNYGSLSASECLLGEVLETEDTHPTYTGHVSTNSILCLTISHDGLRFITAGSDCVCRVYDARNLKEINQCKATNSEKSMNGHKMRVCAVLYHPLGAGHIEYEHVFVSGGWDDSIMIWDDRCQSALYQYYGPHICGNDSLDIDVDTNFLLAGTWTRDKDLFSIFLFNHTVVAGSEANRAEHQFDKPIYQILQNTITLPSMTYVSKWLDSDTILIGGGNNNIINIINKTKMAVCASIHDLPGAVFSVAVSKVKVKTREKVKPKVKHKEKVKEFRLAICSGNSLFVVKLDGKTIRSTIRP